MKLKFNNIFDLSDARYASAMLAEWIGFGLDNPKVSIQDVQEIVQWVNGPKIILEIGDCTNYDLVQTWLDIVHFDGIECTENNLLAMQNHFGNGNYEWIVKSDQKVDLGNSKFIIHTNDKNLAEECDGIWLVSNDKLDTSNMQNFYAISLDCKYHAEPSLKNYEQWNDFLENLVLD